MNCYFASTTLTHTIILNSTPTPTRRLLFLEPAGQVINFFILLFFVYFMKHNLTSIYSR